MIKKTILIVLTVSLLILYGCSKYVDEKNRIEYNKNKISENQNEIEKDKNEINSSDASNQETANVSSLGGISLGYSPEMVVNILGDNYIESTEPDYFGIMGEDITVWSYDNGIVIRIGETTGKVLSVTSKNPDFQTDMGIKVGDDAETVFNAYKPKFEEAKSRHSDEILEGWYLVGDGTVMIFDFDKSDNAVINSNIASDSKVEEIILAYWKHFD
ncbi:MAG TPA: hypothetical protein GXX20_06315 [Clostridiaceae bacterium]|nr:hypothetical protein [Clostridiaceae bacterium]